MKKHDCTYEEVYLSHGILVHSCSRQFTMLDPVRAHQLLDLFSHKGWSSMEMTFALASEIPLGVDGEKMGEDNRELIQNSNNMLPNENLHECKIAAVVNTHTAAAIRIASATSRGFAVRGVPGATALIAFK